MAVLPLGAVRRLSDPALAGDAQEEPGNASITVRVTCVLMVAKSLHGSLSSQESHLRDRLKPLHFGGLGCQKWGFVSCTLAPCSILQRIREGLSQTVYLFEETTHVLRVMSTCKFCFSQNFVSIPMPYMSRICFQ